DSVDSDGDGLSNWQEYLMGRNPLVWDNLTIQAGTNSQDTGFHLTVNGQPGVSYALQASVNLADWTPIVQVSCPYSNHGAVVLMDPASKDYPRRFYRLAPLSTVAKPVLGLRLTRSSTNTGLELILHGTVGFNYRLQGSSNLLDWEPVCEVLCTNATIQLQDLE